MNETWESVGFRIANEFGVDPKPDTVRREVLRLVRRFRKLQSEVLKLSWLEKSDRSIELRNALRAGNRQP